MVVNAKEEEDVDSKSPGYETSFEILQFGMPVRKTFNRTLTRNLSSNTNFTLL